MWWDLQKVPLSADWWNAPMFYPARGTLAFSELMLGELPIAAPVLWLTGNPALADNVAVILSFPLCALAAHALVKEITGRHDAGVLAGLAFGFGAFRANHIGHLQLLSVYWTPVSLLCLHRAIHRARSAPWLAGAGAACLMQVLCNGYMLFMLPLLIVAWTVWFPRTLRMRVAVLAALAIGLLPMLSILLGYRAVHATYGFVRTYDAARALSADIDTIFQAHPWNVLLGNVIPGPATAWFPGVTAAGLLVAGIAAAVWNRAAVRGTGGWWRRAVLVGAAIAAAAAASVTAFGPWTAGPLTVSHVYKPLSLAVLGVAVYVLSGPRARRAWQTRSTVAFYALASIGFFILALGPEPRFRGAQVLYQAPYRFLMQLPGYDAIRAPDRMALLAAFCLAVVLALTYARWSGLLGGATRRVLWVVLCAGLAADGWFRVPVEPVPAPGPAVDWQQFEAVLELPMLPVTDVISTFRALPYGRPSINGGSGYAPHHYYALRDALDEGDLTVLNGLNLQDPLAVVVPRAASQHDDIVRSLSQVTGAAPVLQSDMWTVYRLPMMPEPPASQPGPPIEIARITSRGSKDAVSEVGIELASTATVEAFGMRIDSDWPLTSRQLGIDTSLDGIEWTAAWSGSSYAVLTRALLRDPLRVQLVLPFAPRPARFVRIRRLREDDRRTLPLAGLSIH